MLKSNELSIRVFLADDNDDDLDNIMNFLWLVTINSLSIHKTIKLVENLVISS